MTVLYHPERPAPREDLSDERQHRKEIARAVQLAMRGQTNNSLSVTLDPNAASTTVVDPRISLSTALHMMPATVSAAGEFVAGSLYAVPTAGQAVIFHRSLSTADRTFMVSLVG